MIRYRWLGGALVLLAACQSRETPQQMQARMDQQSAAAKQAINAVERSYERFTAEGKADSLASLFAQQGRQMPPNAPTAVGRAAIASNEAKMMRGMDVRLTISSETVMANGPMAIETGSYNVDGIPKKGAPKGTKGIRENGKYMAHWHQVNGQWQIIDLIWNTNGSMTMGAPAKPAAKGAAKAPSKSGTKKTGKRK